ncbi:MAG: dienelactone hydrolase family protein [Phycisphaerales bacterium]|nr:dienelactone hydrolase family protein [Phycisphaerales bacterium]
MKGMTSTAAAVGAIGVVLVLGACAVPSREAGEMDAAGTANMADRTPPGFELRRMGEGEQALAYVVYTPEGRGDEAMPAILFLHGAGECGSDGWRQVGHSSIAQAIMDDPKRWPFVVIMPQKPVLKKEWETYDATVMKILDDTVACENIDKSRVYLTGLSQGGHGTWVIGATHPERFAAIAPICGYGDPDMLAGPLASMPVWAFHGLADKVVPPDRTTSITKVLRDRRGKDGAELKESLYPGVGHNSWDNAFAEKELPGWLLKHVKAEK